MGTVGKLANKTEINSKVSDGKPEKPNNTNYTCNNNRDGIKGDADSRGGESESNCGAIINLFTA